MRRIGLQGATDARFLAHAHREQRVVVTTDTDFGTMLALSGAGGPSVILLRGIGDTVDERFDAVVSAIAVVESELLDGAVAVVEPDLRWLPVEG